MVACQRETEAQYIFLVGTESENADSGIKIREIKAFSEKEIGRNVIEVAGGVESGSG